METKEKRIGLVLLGGSENILCEKRKMKVRLKAVRIRKVESMAPKVRKFMSEIFRTTAKR